MENNSIKIIGIINILFLFPSCQHEPFQFGNLVLSENCDPDTVYFQNEILPMLVSNCATAGCHNSITHESDVITTSWDEIMNSNIVKPGNAFGSNLYQVISGSGEESMPPENLLEANKIALVKKWIEQGALNNECMSDCDTLNVTYSSTIEPLINGYCKGCHSGSSPDGSIALESYNDVKNIAMDGSFLGSVNHQVGYTEMPFNSEMLPLCKIDEIRIWIENGYENN